MSILPRDEDTICAVSTPHGVGGISVIRISGIRSNELCRKLGTFLPEFPESHRIYYGTLYHPQSGEALDEVLVSCFAQGKSFTGEEVVEISCHGNPLICEEIILALISVGARAAERGEFTYRAFLNDRIDLAQAEGILSLIDAQSLSAKRLALRQLQGTYSDKLIVFENEITRILAHVEADIDFSAENLETISREEAAISLKRISSEIEKLARSYDLGKKIKDGIHFTFAGLPNVGKSTLFNLLLGEEKAIVTDIPGTTRDVLEGELLYSHVRMIFSDTAGVRKQSSDLIERIGIERSKMKRGEADIVLFVSVAGRDLSAEELEILAESDPNRLLFIMNKSDATQDSEQALCTHFQSQVEKVGNFFNQIENHQEFFSSRLLSVSAFHPDTREQILDHVLKLFGIKNLPQNEIIVIQGRHYENLRGAHRSLSTAENLLMKNESLEFIAFEIKDALLKIQEILGIHYDDQVLDRVFKEFCLGK